MTESRIIPVGAELPAMKSSDRPACHNGQSARKAEGIPKRSTGNRAGAVRRRFGLLNAFIDRALPQLGRTDLAAWLLLYRHAKPDGTVSASGAGTRRCKRRRCGETAGRWSFVVSRMNKNTTGVPAGSTGKAENANVVF